MKKLILLLLMLASFASAQTSLTNLEESNAWHVCQTCANSIGSTARATLTTTLVGQPALAAPARSFAIQALDPYADGYWWMDQPTNKATSISYGFRLFISPDALKASQAIEFEFQQRINGYVFNYAFQANFRSGFWKTFDYGKKQWVASKVPLTMLTPDKWHHIWYTGKRTATGVVIPFINIDNQEYAVNATYTAPYKGGRDHFTNAFQLDSNGKTPPTPYGVFVDRMNLNFR